MSAGAPQPSSPKTIGELFGKLSDQIRELVHGEILLAKAKAAIMAKKCGMGGALLAVAAVLALYLLGLVLWLFVELFKLVVAPPLAILIVSAILLLVIGILAGVGASMLKKGLQDKPAPQVGMKENVAAAKAGAKKGLNK
ncbi:MAG: phage holin family protein [Actinomycetaceae bacterium]|nr:phage holin family protein [Actinomycetaceae bacterium]